MNPTEEGLLPVRMLNEYAYCPRLFHLMLVEGRWADNVYTEEGREAHRRVDRLEHVLPDPEGAPLAEAAESAADESGDDRPTVSRSVSLGSDDLGITAKLDLVATAGEDAVPVETKRGRVPRNEERSWEPERVQLMAQGLLLREHGYSCDHGVLYYAGSRTRVDVPFTADLEGRTLRFIAEAKAAALSSEFPPPLDDSPKCNGCSLAGICLPDETLALQEVPAADGSARADAVRRLYPARDDALPLYVQEQGARVGKRGGVLVVSKGEEELGSARLKDVSHLVLCGNVGISAQTLQLLCEANVPVVHLSRGHWFYGITAGITLRNAFDRAAQFRTASDEGRTLAFARAVVAAKAANQRRLLVRNAGSRAEPQTTEMATLLRKVPHAHDAGELLGLEGALASKYFSRFSELLQPRDFDAEWDFDARNRRPPKDPVNALLSFGYAMLAKECTVALLGEGLDPWWGLYHQPRHGRPALALDLMEEFRPLVVDSAVITAVNTGMVRGADFTRTKAACILTDRGRKAFIRAYEARLDQLVTHPTFQYRCSWRVMVRLQARLLSRWLRGDVPEYSGMTTR
ncbi:MAG TPA: CRISPR-associated endonuclease Cas1 [Longimicrobiales bacterium]|nr:CRISPR-associated endonuclease Cas1 [Longimicrobiales bacterium]